MNYRHAFHAGNFGDVLKHALLVSLIRSLQQKEKGFLYLDTHAGRGSYDLTDAGQGLTRERTPEWPDGVGRLLGGRAVPPSPGYGAAGGSSGGEAVELPAPLADYVAQVKAHDRSLGNLAPEIRYYPGSPALARQLARPQDRLALFEKQPDECAALQIGMGPGKRISVRPADGYEAVGAMLPAPERRALVLIDPPYEAQDEWKLIGDALAAGLRRAPDATYAIWYPLTSRMRPDLFFKSLIELKPPPTLAVELTIAGESGGPALRSPKGEAGKLRGCAVAILNPPWKFDAVSRVVVQSLAARLALDGGAKGEVAWLVPDR